jgi:hypothetical protein
MITCDHWDALPDASGGYATLLLLFMVFDDRDTQFIYFQF